jgi:hypothetical protein
VQSQNWYFWPSHTHPHSLLFPNHLAIWDFIEPNRDLGLAVEHLRVRQQGSGTWEWGSGERGKLTYTLYRTGSGERVLVFFMDP